MRDDNESYCEGNDQAERGYSTIFSRTGLRTDLI